jgi:hypothetical protein
MKPSEAGGGSGGGTFKPTEEWLIAFKRQYSGTLALLVAPYAASHLAGLGAAASPGDPRTRELVADALGDTLMGVLPWDPGTCSLLTHIKEAVARRAASHRRRARRFPHQSLDAGAVHGGLAVRREAERVLLERWPDPRDAAQAADDLDELRQLAAGDPEVLAYLEARAQGVSRAELMRRTGLSLDAYRRVRRRVQRWIDRLTGMARRDKRGAKA